MGSAPNPQPGARLLLVDDTAANLDVLRALLEAEGYRVVLASTGPLALKLAARRPPDLVLLDIMMPEMDGYEVCRRLKQDEALAAIPVIFITGKDKTEDLVTGFQAGGVDYITKPFRDQEVLQRVQTHLTLSQLRLDLAQKNEALEEKNRVLEEEIARRQALKGQVARIGAQEAEHWGLEGFVGQSPTLQRVFKRIRRMQQNHTMSVLVTGESGTGKELVARAIHFGGENRMGPFVPVNCASLPGELVESLLFGHTKGAFTGANTDHLGYFEMAHEGTLFLDEVGEMPLALQPKLLRVLEDGEVWRVGAHKSRTVDVRVVAATNSDLEQRAQQGAFRQDLFFRLAHFRVEVPPLRDRPDDIPLLAQHFLQHFAQEMGRDVPALTPEALELLQAYSFPGNVRELKNIMCSASIESNGEIEPLHLDLLAYMDPAPTTDVERSPLVGDGSDGDLLTLTEAERQHIIRALMATGGKVFGPQGAAKRLGINPQTLRYRIRKLGIKWPP